MNLNVQNIILKFHKNKPMIINSLKENDIN